MATSANPFCKFLSRRKILYFSLKRPAQAAVRECNGDFQEAIQTGDELLEFRDGEPVASSKASPFASGMLNEFYQKGCQEKSSAFRFRVTVA